jgi:hypothetical protein
VGYIEIPDDMPEWGCWGFGGDRIDATITAAATMAVLSAAAAGEERR